MKNLLIYLIALISGGVGVFAFSPFDYWAVAYLSLMGLLFVAKFAEKKTALLGSFLWGLSFFSIGVSWLHVSINQFGGAPLVVSYLLVLLLAAYLSLYPVLFTYLVQRFKVRSLVLFPVIWTFTEFLRGWIFTGFPWLQFGYTQIDSPFRGIAPIFGVQGLTFFTLWASAVILNVLSALRQKKWTILCVNSMILVMVASLSIVVGKKSFVQSQPEKSLKITLAQGNIAQNLKWDQDYFDKTLQIYADLIRENLGKSDVIILPESAIPMLENRLLPLFQQWEIAAQKQGTELVIGTVYEEPSMNKLFNSIIVLGNPDDVYSLGTANRYNKHHLVPFGEYVPLEGLLRPLGSVFNLPMSAFQSGEARQKTLQVKKHQFSPAICYEIIFGAQLQHNVAQGTDYILTVSNDAWFGDSIGPWQHLQMARMRALELGKPVIRATNTGISVFIDAQGKIVAQAPQFEATDLTYSIAPTTGKTPYTALGNAPLYLLSALFVLLHFIGALVRRKLTR